jgi:hypothetical protein
VLVACLPDKADKRAPQRPGTIGLLDEMFDSILTGNTPKARRAFLQYATTE